MCNSDHFVALGDVFGEKKRRVLCVVRQGADDLMINNTYVEEGGMA